MAAAASAVAAAELVWRLLWMCGTLQRSRLFRIQRRREEDYEYFVVAARSGTEPSTGAATDDVAGFRPAGVSGLIEAGGSAWIPGQIGWRSEAVQPRRVRYGVARRTRFGGGREHSGVGLDYQSETR